MKEKFNMNTDKYRWPDFFIVGAPRCGTTALSEYLKQHPNIFMPKMKEPHFFGKDLKFRIPRISKVKYLELYKNREENMIAGDASVMYLMSKTAASEIKSQCPNAKIIIMLRNPVDLLYSLHSKMLLTGNEDICDFEKALAVENERRQGQRIPKLVQRYDLLYYSEVVKFYEQVIRYRNIFGWENVLVVFYKDFKEDTSGQLKKILSFLGVTEFIKPEYKIVNANQVVRFPILRDVQRMILNSSKTRNFVRVCIPTFIRPLGYSLMKYIYTKTASRKPLPKETRLLLQKKYIIDVQKLAELLNVDLSHWMN